ncbi:MAG: HepT-like ribonuclease domain-containing protein [Methanoregula sp.]|uniref:HepT-like ribonuclease domain-containing protein n=1 Tax=Methanoregula sp. TaxID=2052170 RepID=UPI003C7910AA
MKSDRVLLIHIKNEMVFLQRIAKGRTLDDLVHDDYFSHAVRSAIEVIGEASKNISPAVREQYPAIEWKRMSQTRDRIIHRYFDINWQIVWDLITIELPVLEPKISAIIRDLDRNSSL